MRTIVLEVWFCLVVVHGLHSTTSAASVSLDIEGTIKIKRNTNNRPIIGVLSQELSPTVSGFYPDYKSYIAASYVKYLEGAGARVVPIWINKEKSYYKTLIQYINGVLLPGGAVYFNVTNGYAEAGALLYKYATQINSKGDYFPIWGTCLGFELLAFLAAGQKELRLNCYSEDVALPLHFKPDYFDSKLFKSAPAKVIHILSSKNVTANYHTLCITEEKLLNLGLTIDWHVLSTNFDENGLKFVSSMESRHYPFYGVQYHPEKNGYEFKSTKNIPHSSEAVYIMQYFANFFVDEARKNSHRYPNSSMEYESLIYKYQPTYTEDHLSFEQCYFFS